MPPYLIDSNIFIAAEGHGADGHSYGVGAATLIRLINQLGYELVVSNGTLSDILAAEPARLAKRERALQKYVVLRPVLEAQSVRGEFPTQLSDNDSADLKVLSTFATGACADAAVVQVWRTCLASMRLWHSLARSEIRIYYGCPRPVSSRLSVPRRCHCRIRHGSYDARRDGARWQFALMITGSTRRRSPTAAGLVE